MTNEQYMRHALLLAQCGAGHVSPNPLVGAVIVKDDKIIGEGFHEKCGQLHAERNAFANCTTDPNGADLYVTLEPCCHYGKTPPCTEAIIERNIRRVFVGSMDSNPLVAGKGLRILKEHGIEVYTDILKNECEELNEIFFHYILHKTPFVMMKYAMTLDGKIATVGGEARWISNESSRKDTHFDRNQYSAIMIGIDTLLQDDPMLNTRLSEEDFLEHFSHVTSSPSAIKFGMHHPIRIICDSTLRTPLTSRIVQTAKDIPVLLATCISDEKKYCPYQEAGVTILCIPPKDGHLDLNYLMKELGKRGIDSVILEGGGTLNDSMLREGLVHKVKSYLAPKLFGGSSAKSPVEGTGCLHIADAISLHTTRVYPLGDDLVIESEVK